MNVGNDGGPPMMGPTQDERTLSMINWFLGIILGIIAPLIFMLIGQGKPFLYANAMQHLTFQIWMLIAWVAISILGVVTCGIGMILYLVPWILGLVFCIMGGIAANNGQVYEPPFTAKFARQWFKV